jgi:hypothetical protein
LRKTERYQNSFLSIERPFTNVYNWAIDELVDVDDDELGIKSQLLVYSRTFPAHLVNLPILSLGLGFDSMITLIRGIIQKFTSSAGKSQKFSATGRPDESFTDREAFGQYGFASAAIRCRGNPAKNRSERLSCCIR